MNPRIDRALLESFRAELEPPRRSIVELIGQGVLDAELAALAWILVEARLPVIVGGLAQGAGKTTLLEALLDFLPSTTRRVDLAGSFEDFAWLPEAARLGWAADRTGTTGGGEPAPTRPAIPIGPATGYLVAAELSEHLPIYTSGRAARTLIRAASIGYGVGATIHADRLEDIHDQLRSPDVGLTDDELSYLGMILVVRPEREPGGLIRRRVVAAHYARPVGRDEHGHVQRLPPAVLAVRDPGADHLEHFAWGVMPELALRLGRAAGDVEQDRDRRAAILDDLSATGEVDVGTVREAIAAARRPSEIDHLH